LFEFFETTTEYANTLAEQSSVGFELGLARSAKTDTALLTLEVRPPSDEAAREMAQLSELDFQFAFVASRTLGKNIEDERVSVEHTQPDQFFEVALLTWRQRMVDQDDLSAAIDRHLTNFFGLTAANEITWIGALATPRHRGRSTDPRRLGELREFFEIFGFDRSVESDTNENGALSAAGTLKHARSGSLGSNRFDIVLCLSGQRNTNVTRGDDR